MSGLRNSKNLLREIVEEITIEADELSTDDKKDNYTQGQLLAYANALGIIKSVLSGENLKDFGLDYDIDKKYL